MAYKSIEGAWTLLRGLTSLKRHGTKGKGEGEERGKQTSSGTTFSMLQGSWGLGRIGDKNEFSHMQHVCRLLLHVLRSWGFCVQSLHMCSCTHNASGQRRNSKGTPDFHLHVFSNCPPRANSVTVSEGLQRSVHRRRIFSSSGGWISLPSEMLKMLASRVIISQNVKLRAGMKKRYLEMGLN